MVKEIIKDEFFLKQKSKSCTKEDLYIANELLETIQAYKEQCVGMAANMIGYLKTMMVVLDENKAERHIRGGMATKMKYSHLHNS